jgi:hypothetical protein
VLSQKYKAWKAKTKYVDIQDKKTYLCKTISDERRAIPSYIPPRNPESIVLVGGMNFRDGTSPIPPHTDDIRLRMLASIMDGALVKSIGSDRNDTALHIHGDVRRMHTRRSLAYKEVLQCDLFVLDSYFLQSTYFESNSNTNGYGNTWFSPGGQVDVLLGAKCKALILPNDKWGRMWGFYQSNRNYLSSKGITARLVGAEYNPLAKATLKAEKDTNWLTLKSGDPAYNRTEIQQEGLYLGKPPFILACKTAEQDEVSAWLKSI